MILRERLQKEIKDRIKKKETVTAMAIQEKTPVLISETRIMGAVIHPSSKRSGEWQVSFWDERGFSGDTTRKTKLDAIKVAIDDGYLVIDTEKKFQEISTSEKFINGIIGFLNAKKRLETTP